MASGSSSARPSTCRTLWPSCSPDGSTKVAEDEAERKFVEDTLIRGEAAEADEKGKLPPDATHEIVEEPEGEPPTIKRRRFKAF